MNKNSLPRFILYFSLFLTPLFLFALQLQHPEYGYVVDIPEGWEVVDVEGNTASFSDPTGRAVFQVSAFPTNTYRSLDDLVADTIEGLAAEGETAEFSFHGAKAVFADLAFTAGRFPARGYFVFCTIGENRFVLNAFVAQSAYERFHDVLISCVDSFAADDALMLPGAVSQFYYPYPAPDPTEFSIEVPGETRIVYEDPGAADAIQVLIEREARILSTYTEGWEEAWRRYYRIVFRECHLRFVPYALILESAFEAHVRENHDTANGPLDRRFGATTDPAGYAAFLLEWLQGFGYERRQWTVSDLISPIRAVLDHTGDCDARALIFVSLLEHAGIDAVLMVSRRHAHAMGACDVSGPGARFPFEEKRYLVAELTDRVELGLIAQDMADPAGWLGVQLGR